MIGNLEYGYRACNSKDIRRYIKCYELPLRIYTLGSGQIYTPLSGTNLISRGNPTLVLVDEGADFFIAVVVQKRDGVALLFDDWCAFTQFSGVYL
jgi:hypothetical protein